MPEVTIGEIVAAYRVLDEILKAIYDLYLDLVWLGTKLIRL
jgi:hypothetical protein